MDAKIASLEDINIHLDNDEEYQWFLENESLEEIVDYENTNHEKASYTPFLMNTDSTSYDVAMQLHPMQCTEFQRLAHLAHDLGPLPTLWYCATLAKEILPNAHAVPGSDCLHSASVTSLV